MESSNKRHDEEWKDAVEKAWDRDERRFHHYMDLLEWWNPRINLLSRDVSRETIQFHVRHSLSLLPFLEPDTKVVDMGTGGGLPGLVLAMADPQRSYVLNDIQQKKCMAVKHMIHELGLVNAEVLPGDVRTLAFEGAIQWVSKHAFKMDQILPALRGNEWRQAAALKGLEDIHHEMKGLMGGAHQHEVMDLQEAWKDERYAGKGLWIIRRRGGE